MFEAPVPRCSMKTRSRLVFSARSGRTRLIVSTAESPGPPANQTIGSACRLGSVAGITTTRIGIRRPPPPSRSSGTVSVPHRADTPSTVHAFSTRPVDDVPVDDPPHPGSTPKLTTASAPTHYPVPAGTTVNSAAPPHGVIVRGATIPRQCHWSLLRRSGATLAGRGLRAVRAAMGAAVVVALVSQFWRSREIAGFGPIDFCSSFTVLSIVGDLGIACLTRSTLS